MFKREDLDKQVLEALEQAKGIAQPLSPINAILQRIKEIKQTEEKKKVRW